MAAAADRAGLNAGFKANIDRAGGERTLTVELFDAEQLVTHYWCNSGFTRGGIFGDAVRDLDGLLQMLPEFSASQAYLWPSPADAALLGELLEAFEPVPNVAIGEVTGQQVLGLHNLQVSSE